MIQFHEQNLVGEDPGHLTRLLTCLKLSGHVVGLLINFNVPLHQGRNHTHGAAKKKS
jgi:hypothetical protein